MDTSYTTDILGTLLNLRKNNIVILSRMIVLLQLCRQSRLIEGIVLHLECFVVWGDTHPLLFPSLLAKEGVR